MPTELELLEQAFSSVEEVCSQLSLADWDKPTDCPGWTVKDNLSHLASYEAVASGLAELATAPIDHLTHFTPGFGEANEREVEARRGIPGPQVLDEYRQATGARLKHLGSLDDAAWETDESQFPWGTANTKQMLPIRVLDVFYHEQDIRRATGKPGHLDGAVAAFAFTRMSTLALPRIVGKTVAPPDGTTVRWDVPAPGRAFGIEMRDGKAVPVEPPARATVHFSSDLETFLCLFGGRWKPDATRADGKLTVEGDAELANQILDNITVVP